jgi:hypothetical protein
LKLARERGLALHVHTDLLRLQTLLGQVLGIPVIWAHGGFDVPESALRQLLGEHEQLYIELSFRKGITDAGRLTPVWSALTIDSPSRFLTGTDIYIPYAG